MWYVFLAWLTIFLSCIAGSFLNEAGFSGPGCWLLGGVTGIVVSCFISHVE